MKTLKAVAVMLLGMALAGSVWGHSSPTPTLIVDQSSVTETQFRFTVTWDDSGVEQHRDRYGNYGQWFIHGPPCGSNALGHNTFPGPPTAPGYRSGTYKCEYGPDLDRDWGGQTIRLKVRMFHDALSHRRPHHNLSDWSNTVDVIIPAPEPPEPEPPEPEPPSEPEPEPPESCTADSPFGKRWLVPLFGETARLRVTNREGDTSIDVCAHDVNGDRVDCLLNMALGPHAIGRWDRSSFPEHDVVGPWTLRITARVSEGSNGVFVTVLTKPGAGGVTLLPAVRTDR